MKGWIIPANDAVVFNELNTWQIMQMALKISSFLASPCAVQLNKMCIENKSKIFFFGVHTCFESELWLSSVHLLRVISLTCSSILGPPGDEFDGFQGRFAFHPYFLFMGSFAFCPLICNVVIFIQA